MFRLQRSLGEEFVATLNAEFTDLLAGGAFVNAAR